jgi:hypothetical protein
MTVTAETTNPLQLTDHDYIIGTGDPAPSIDELSRGRWVFGTNFHLYPDTPVRLRVYEDERRVVVQFGNHAAGLDLYANADQLDRLIILLSAARQRLP